MRKIDIFNHIFPEPFHTLMMKVAGDHTDIGKRVRGIPMLTDLDERLRMMDRFGDDYRQVPALASPPLEAPHHQSRQYNRYARMMLRHELLLRFRIHSYLTRSLLPCGCIPA